MEPIAVKKVNLIVGYNQAGPVMITLYASPMKGLVLLGRPARYLVMQTKDMANGGVITTEYNLDRYYGVEFVEVTPEPVAVPEVSVE